MIPPPPRSTLFPYTTLFRSQNRQPSYKVDADWPKQLPSNWIMGQVSGIAVDHEDHIWVLQRDRKSTRLNSSHQIISYAVFCLKKKKKKNNNNILSQCSRHSE